MYNHPPSIIRHVLKSFAYALLAESYRDTEMPMATFADTKSQLDAFTTAPFFPFLDATNPCQTNRPADTPSSVCSSPRAWPFCQARCGGRSSSRKPLSLGVRALGCWSLHDKQRNLVQRSRNSTRLAGSRTAMNSMSKVVIVHGLQQH